MSEIQFGTDGWRAVIAREFTMANLRRAVQAICAHHGDAGSRLVVVGYDRRFLARRFAQEAAGVLLGNGFRVRMSDRAETTPAVSCQVADSGAAFGLVLTASHNPPEFLGLKIKTRVGASAPPELTREVERLLDRDPVRFTPPERGIGTGQLEIEPFAPAHLGRMTAMVDLPLIRSAGLRVAVDSMHGSGARILEELLVDSSTKVETLRGDRDPLFSGHPPEPIQANMRPLLREVAAGGYSLGFATDGDADRIAAVDEKGVFLSPLRLIGVLALHLVRRRKVPGAIAKTFANTIYLDRIAAAEGRPFHCFPIGFKHIAAMLERGELAIGGEESGGIGFAGYIPERDGLLAGLFLMEAVAMAGAPLSSLVDEMVHEFGDYHYDRQDLHRPSDEIRAAMERLSHSPPERIAGHAVSGVDPLDGLKLLLGDEGWLLLRASGTEAVLRVYAEARSPSTVAALLAEGVRLVEAAGTGPAAGS